MLIDSRARRLALPRGPENGLYWRQRPSVARLGELEAIGTQMRLGFRQQAAQIRKVSPRIVVNDR